MKVGGPSRVARCLAATKLCGAQQNRRERAWSVHSHNTPRCVFTRWWMREWHVHARRAPAAASSSWFPVARTARIPAPSRLQRTVVNMYVQFEPQHFDEPIKGLACRVAHLVSEMTGIPLDDEGNVEGASDNDSLVSALLTLAYYVDDHCGGASDGLQRSVASVLRECATTLDPPGQV